VRVHEVPGARASGQRNAINNLIDIGSNERITAVFVRPESDSEAHYMLMVTKNGYIKKTAMAESANVRRNGLIAISLQKATSWTGSHRRIGRSDHRTELGKRFASARRRSAPWAATRRRDRHQVGQGDAVAGMATAVRAVTLLVITQAATANGTSVRVPHAPPSGKVCSRLRS